MPRFAGRFFWTGIGRLGKWVEPLNEAAAHAKYAREDMPMDFEKRLEKAVERGQRRRSARDAAEAHRAMSEEELRRLHTQYRLELSEYIETCLKKLVNHFPGFRLQEVVSERGWGASIRRDDVSLSGGRRDNLFSQLEMVIAPFGKYHVLELVAKGTIRNKELFHRTFYQRLDEADPTSFTNMIDLWVLEYAEQFAAQE